MYCEYAFKYLVNIVVQEIWKSHKATYMYKTSMAWWKAVGGITSRSAVFEVL